MKSLKWVHHNAALWIAYDPRGAKLDAYKTMFARVYWRGVTDTFEVHTNDWLTTDRRCKTLEEAKTIVEALYALESH